MNYTDEKLFNLVEDMIYETEEKTAECEHDIINDDGMNVCIICGFIQDYEFVNEYAIYDRCTIKQQSIYKRKAYLQVILKKYNIQRSLWGRIISLFCRMERIFEKEDIGRTNMISYNVTIRGILWKQHRYKEAKKVPLLKTKKTRIIHQKIFYKLWDMMNNINYI